MRLGFAVRHGLRKGRQLLEAGAAQHRPTLSGSEGNRGVGTARRTGGPGFRAHFGAAPRALGLALFAVFGIVLELFVEKEQLLARSEYELGAAIDAFESLVDEFHGRYPKEREHTEIGHELMSLPVPLPCLLSSIHNKGPGRKPSAAVNSSPGEPEDVQYSIMLCGCKATNSNVSKRRMPPRSFLGFSLSPHLLRENQGRHRVHRVGVSPALCEPSCDCAYAPKPPLHASSRLVSGSRSDA